MPPVPLAVKDLSCAGKQATAPDTRAPVQAPLGRRLMRLAGLLLPRFKSGRTYQDPMFKRPDLVEDDYYRLRRQPGGR